MMKNGKEKGIQKAIPIKVPTAAACILILKNIFRINIAMSPQNCARKYTMSTCGIAGVVFKLWST
jgi:hypothetical protein